MAKEDYTTYPEVDPNNHIDLVGTDHIDFHAYNTETAYRSKDRGAGHFTDFEHLLHVKQVTASVENSSGVVWALTKDVDGMQSLDNAGKTFLYIFMRRVATANQRIELRECIAGVISLESYEKFNGLNTDYWLTIKKVSTAWTMKVYSDASRKILLDTVSKTLGSDYNFQHIYACSTLDGGEARNALFTIDDLDLQEVAPPVAAVTSPMAARMMAAGVLQ
ncbi:unnamed protein product [marine sediment metagenome]|uniref:Uncharacterized protein n=1 Tax=marine sediment metagenome TaxID=412755 RepID=X1EQE9_9ZZZZ